MYSDEPKFKIGDLVYTKSSDEIGGIIGVIEQVIPVVHKYNTGNNDLYEYELSTSYGRFVRESQMYKVINNGTQFIINYINE